MCGAGWHLIIKQSPMLSFNRTQYLRKKKKKTTEENMFPLDIQRLTNACIEIEIFEILKNFLKLSFICSLILGGKEEGFTRRSYTWAMRCAVVEGYGLIYTPWGSFNARRNFDTWPFSFFASIREMFVNTQQPSLHCRHNLEAHASKVSAVEYKPKVHGYIPGC